MKGRMQGDPKLPLPQEGSRTPRNTQFLGPSRAYNSNWTSIGSSVLVGLAVLSNRHRDHATSVGVGCTTALDAYNTA